ncbi:hypothetical protein BDQ12DRAFT_708166 [Crucibulum laeve]|uniref:4a-hydroxytetrahydrobiopterin dehydratase n=1 Tax=Crucibulum laeve TaxID=68775 RepID=A0A5C3MS48_9AGAR|nr:hypothetical protein BDQ12DRAFT_708166 [Crucibulum laeve]
MAAILRRDIGSLLSASKARSLPCWTRAASRHGRIQLEQRLASQLSIRFFSDVASENDVKKVPAGNNIASDGSGSGGDVVSEQHVDFEEVALPVIKLELPSEVADTTPSKRSSKFNRNKSTLKQKKPDPSAASTSNQPPSDSTDKKTPYVLRKPVPHTPLGPPIPTALSLQGVGYPTPWITNEEAQSSLYPLYARGWEARFIDVNGRSTAMLWTRYMLKSFDAEGARFLLNISRIINTENHHPHYMKITFKKGGYVLEIATYTHQASPPPTVFHIGHSLSDPLDLPPHPTKLIAPGITVRDLRFAIRIENTFEDMFGPFAVGNREKPVVFGGDMPTWEELYARLLLGGKPLP